MWWIWGWTVDSEAFVKAAADNEAEVIALSALLTTTMPAMQATVTAVKEAGLTVKTIIGGAPVTKAFADPRSAQTDTAPMRPARSSW